MPLNPNRVNDLSGLGNGISMVLKQFYKLRSEQLKQCLQSTNLSSVDINHVFTEAEHQFSKYAGSQTLDNMFKKSETLYRQTSQILNSDYVAKNMPNFMSPKRSLFTHRSRTIQYIQAAAYTSDAPPIKPKPINLKDTHKFEHKLNKFSKEREVPSGRMSRLVNFGGLAAGLGAGAISEMTKRALGMSKASENLTNSLIDSSQSIFLTEDNVQRIVDTLCKVRGAALKLGQMLSIQDEALLSPSLQRIFERVRQSADFMPFKQTETVLQTELGSDYMRLFESLEKSPFAAASIGQVHKGFLKDTNEEVAVKIQYPGVAQSIQSDIDNLMSILNLAQLLPKQMYVENVVDVMKRELLDDKNEHKHIY